MSLKPMKKSDLKKSWMQPRRDSKKRIQPEYHLIITEGTGTEPAYFASIKDIINRKYPGRIRLDICGEGDNTLSLFEKAVHRARISANKYKHVWIVYDTDDFPAYHVNQTAQLCQDNTNEETTFHAIWSNQCFELWFLLHFGFLQSNLHRSAYWSKLTESLVSQGLGAYEKNREDMYAVLYPYLCDAEK